MTNHKSQARVEARPTPPRRYVAPVRGAAREPYRSAGVELDREIRAAICALAARCGTFKADLRFLFVDLQPQRNKPLTITTFGTAIAAIAAHKHVPSDGLQTLEALIVAWFRSLAPARNTPLFELFSNEVRSNAQANIEQAEAVVSRSVSELDQAITATRINIAESQQLLAGFYAERRVAFHRELQQARAPRQPVVLT